MSLATCVCAVNNDLFLIVSSMCQMILLSFLASLVWAIGVCDMEVYICPKVGMGLILRLYSHVPSLGCSLTRMQGMIQKPDGPTNLCQGFERLALVHLKLVPDREQHAFSLSPCQP